MPTSPDRNSYDELEKLLDVAEKLQTRVDSISNRFYLVATLMSGGILAAIVFLFLARGKSGQFSIDLLASFFIIILIVMISSSLLFRLRSLLRRDRRALYEVVEIINETERIASLQEEWTSLQRANFRIRLSRLAIGPNTTVLEIKDSETEGFVRVSLDFLHGINWPALFQNVREIDIFFSYGRTWLGMNEGHLIGVSKRHDTRVRLILPDIRDAELMKILARRFQLTQEVMVSRIIETMSNFLRIFKQEESKCDFSIWHTSVIPAYSFYRFDNIIIMALYKHRSGRGNVPVIITDPTTAIHAFLSEELNSFFSSNEGLARKESYSLAKG